MQVFIVLISLGVVFFGSSQTALAVPPPDFIFNVGSQLVQIFSVATVFLSALALSASQFLKAYLQPIKHRRLLWGGVAVVIIGLALGTAYYAQQYQQNQAYQQWITQSQIEDMDDLATNNPLDQLQLTATAAKIPLLPEHPPAAASTEKISNDSVDDRYVQFIRNYYSNLANGKIEDAYRVSTQKVSLETYKSWYQDLKTVSVDHVTLISDHSYSLELSLEDGTGVTRYAVLMQLAEEKGVGLHIADSSVRTLSSPRVAAGISVARTEPAPPEMLAPDAASYSSNSQLLQLPMAISNADFQKAIEAGPVYVLDAREDEEFEMGNFPGSIHIRAADLVAGEWIRIPADQTLYVFCWSGMRGKEVADFLRSKNLPARYVEKGASDWVASGGKWNGEIKLTAWYGASQYVKLFTLAEIKEMKTQNVVLVDSRTKAKYDKKHIPGSINIPIIYTPSSQIESALSQVPPQASVVTICDDFISCFDAKITGIKLEKAGNVFLGRYNKPWEYQ